MPETPPNINEFNQIAALVFAQLYREFPVVVDIDRGAIAKALGVSEGDWGTYMLPSGRSFNDVLSGTIGWLMADKYTIGNGSSPFQRVILTTKGLRVMNAVPSPLEETVGTKLRKATATSSGAFDLSKLVTSLAGRLAGLRRAWEAADTRRSGARRADYRAGQSARTRAGRLPGPRGA